MNLKKHFLLLLFVFRIATIPISAIELTQTDNKGFVSPASFGYETLPSINISGDHDIGSIPTITSVSEMGAAVCDIQIDAPEGPAGIKPQLHLTYNSQIGTGIAGLGFELSGISSITRGSRNIFHDGKAVGITYVDDDAFYLDGKRLFLVTSKNGERVYNPEGDVNTFVYLRHDATDNSVVTFEMKGSDGKTCTFGQTAESRNDVVNSSGTTNTSCWYIDKCVDRCGNIINYKYTKDQRHIYPSTIEYGGNIGKISNTKSYIDFSYDKLGKNEAMPYRLCGQQAYIGLILNSITTRTGGEVFRKYHCSYETSNYGGMSKRLNEISVSNGNGKTLPPTTIAWNPVSPNYKASDIGIQLMPETRDLTLSNRRYQALDINSDGYSDIVEIADAAEKGSGTNYSTYLNLYINEAKQGDSVPQFILRKTIKTSPNIGDKWTSYWNMPITIDYDGDGLADFVMPRIQDEKNNNGIIWEIIPGCNMAQNKWNGTLISVGTQSKGTRNIFSYGDFDNDGRTEILQIEQDARSGQFPCHLVKFSGTYTIGERVVSDFHIKLASEPKAIYIADFNANGMDDLLLVCKSGYSIFWNTGDSIPFNDTQQTYRTDVKYVANMRLGDFNGDGTPDLAMNENGEAQYCIAFGNGDGTFSIGSSFTPTLQGKKVDDNHPRYIMEVVDLDHDGRSDMIIGIQNSRSMSFNDFAWLYSNGNTMAEKKHVSTIEDEDSKWFNTIIGHFTGMGVTELIHLGGNILNGDRFGSSGGKANRIYYDSSWRVGAGLVKNITDGKGNYSNFMYSNMFDKDAYTNNKPSAWPTINTFHTNALVKSVTKSNGILGECEEAYKYANLQFGATGRGLLPFEKIQVYNNSTETTTTIEIEKWDEDLNLPISSTINIVGTDWNKSIRSESTLEKKGNGNYMLLPTNVMETNSDGTTCDIIYQYDNTYGFVTSTSKCHENYTSESITYGDYVCKHGTWLPTKIKSETKHPDDKKSHVTNTEIKYDDIGLPILTITNVGTGKETKKKTKYDIWGNIVSETIEADGANAVEKINAFDDSGRFLVRESTNPSSSTLEYTHDTWGNIVEEANITNPQHPLTTKSCYDNWGRNICTTSPRGATAATYYCSPADGEYAIVEMGDGMPWSATWYDNMNHKLMEQTIGIGGLPITRTYKYDKKGNTISISFENGKYKHIEQMEYDANNRVSKWTDNTGKKATISYGKRSVDININGRRYSRTYDSWGNTTKAADPLCIINNSYSSNGKIIRSGISPFLSNIEYDVNGYRKSLADPDAGTTTYENNGLGQLLKQTDSKGVETTCTYDGLNRLIATSTDGMAATYSFGKSGNGINLPIKEQIGNMVAEREYNEYGDVVRESRNIDGTRLAFTFGYDSLGRICEQTYPNGLHLRYIYDCYGNKTQTLNGKNNIWKFLSSDGLVKKEMLGSDFTRTTTMDENGHLSSIKLEKDGKPLHEMNFEYDPVSGNLLLRKGMEPYGTTEKFTYDVLDRLTSYTEQEHFVREMKYDKHGRILYKYGVGDYEFGKGHQVSFVTNELDSITGYPQKTLYNGYGKVSQITGINGTLNIGYGPDMERWVEEDARKLSTTYFFGDYEHTEMPSDYQDICYLDGGVMYISSRQSADICIPFFDNLGSYTKIYHPSGRVIFHAAYDPWGKPTYLINNIGFYRGYCGHEMLDGGWLVNMNGRVYDPWIATFLSPDNYIQDPFNSQNFNRYGYCVNNPLKYTDPSGNSFVIFLGFTLFNVASSMMMASMNGQNVWKAAARSAVSSVASYGIGQAFGTIGSLGHEALRAGAHGIAGGISSVVGGDNFFSGFAAGSLASGLSSYASSLKFGIGGTIASSTMIGGLSSWASGGDILSGALQGLNVGLLNHGIHDSMANWETEADGTKIAPNELEEVVCIAAYPIALSSQIGFVGIGADYANYKWLKAKTTTKSKLVYNAKKFSRDYLGHRIKANNAEIYRKTIPNKLSDLSKRLGYAGIATNIYENISEISATGEVGYGNAFDIVMSGVSSMPKLGPIFGISYFAADYIWFNYNGFTIKQSLNNEFGTFNIK